MGEKTGKVWLVGAGPSDAGLMTLRGREVLNKADVVIYDRLLGVSILAMIPPGAKKIDVGKSPDQHPIPQKEINRILVREALAGNRVVRLKGGDPFLFGRGGEELDALWENGIPYEVVPGVSSAISVPAYAGIPVTHREYSSSLHIFTGHFSKDNEISLDYAALANLRGTLIFLMGVASVERICYGLLRAGMPGDTPAAAVENGTTARQRCVVATLETLAGKIAEHGIHSPAVIVIGQTVSLANRLSWVSNRPLYGKRIVVTRPRNQSDDFCEKIRNLGGETIAFPCIETVPFEENKMAETIQQLDSFVWITFSSVFGVDVFFEALRRTGRDTRALGSTKIAAIGTATAKRLEMHGVLPDLIPQWFDGAHLGKALAKSAEPGDNILIIRAREGSRALEEQLSRAGIPFEAVPVYETHFTAQTEFPEIRKSIENGEFDLIAFTSPSTVKGFAQAFPHLSFSHCIAVCIGRETAAEADKFGLRVITSKVSTVDGMLETMINL
ncbi:uroporphyrinogen-III C-methyltransferase [Mahella sp.]|uniref:uroporphyrinogen-III C-methyltransferase n=1 Tax=Mahella sp. TaxID=2798721 RepID=UPI0025C0C13A|nr:uroporphyrinogen-III C-methyltransferase [Mahella sp.]MBZ4665804.1 uroporphyrinogen-III synthase [Mahella sp.]MDK2964329.1 uroporphyrinogen methyltransferase / synthase [Verrucomicrobiota bacterium]